MIKRLLIVILLFCSPAFAGDLAVPGTYANIQAAINAAVTGDRVLVAAGDYTDTGYLLFDSGETGKNITIEGVGTVTYASSNASFSVYLDTSIAAGTFTFKNIRFVPSATQANVFRFRCTATSTAKLVIDGCYVATGAVNAAGIYGDSGAGSQRVLEVTDSTFAVGASFIDISSGNSITVTDSTITYGSGVLGYGIYPKGTWTSLKVSGGSITSAGASARNGIIISDANSQVMGSVHLDGVTVTSSVAYHAVQLTSSLTGAMNVRVTNCPISNTSTASSSGALFIGVDSQVTTYMLGTVFVEGNTIGSAASHSLLLGGNSRGATVKDNTVIGAGDFGMVLKGEDLIVTGNKVCQPTPLYVKGAQRPRIIKNTFVTYPYTSGLITTSGVGNRTVTLTGGDWPAWMNSSSRLVISGVAYAPASRDSDSVVTLASDGPAVTDAEYMATSSPGCVEWTTESSDTCVGTTFCDNIVYGVGSDYLLYDWTGTALEARWDNNLYWGGVTAMGRMGGVDYADLAAWRGAWDASVAFPDNDDHSMSMDPQLIGPAIAGNFQLSIVSPAIGRASDGTTIGAWQPSYWRRPAFIEFR